MKIKSYISFLVSNFEFVCLNCSIIENVFFFLAFIRSKVLVLLLGYFFTRAISFLFVFDSNLLFQFRAVN